MFVWILMLANLAGKIAAIATWRTSPWAALAFWFGPDALLAYHLFVPAAQGLVRVAGRFTTTQREVWLTIDDGPDPEDTPRILDLLTHYGAKATFFVIGQDAAAHPELVRAIQKGGHEVAHHTHSHPVASFWCAGPARVRREIDETFSALRAAGAEPVRFRPPAGIKNLWLGGILRSRGLTCIG